MAQFREGLRLISSGQLLKAIGSFEKAVQLKPDEPVFYYNLGLAYHQAGRLCEAVVEYAAALEFDPGLLDAWINMSKAAFGVGQRELGLHAARIAAGLGAQNPEAHVCYYEALKAEGDIAGAKEALGQAVGYYRQMVARHLQKHELAEAWKHALAALRLAPDAPEICNCAGSALLALDRIDEAVQYFIRSKELNADLPATRAYLGHSCLYRNDMGGAIEFYDQALALDPSFDDALYFRAWAELASGRFENGWLEFERRWNTRGPRQKERPAWDGGPLRGRSILVFAEHGFGDTLFFVRYAPMVARLGARVIVECQRPLCDLLTSVEGVSEVVARGDPLPEFDLQVSIMSLPRLFQTTSKTIPDSVPYLKAQRKVTLHGFAEQFKVGLVWQGSSMLILHQNRSIPLSSLESLFSVPNVTFYSLQVCLPSDPSSAPKWAENFIDLGNQLTDFAATASAIEQLDLVVSVDTATAHLAGALGKPVWVLLVYRADWRWLLQGETSAWYPTMRLFRQERLGEGWEPVVERVRSALTDLISQR